MKKEFVLPVVDMGATYGIGSDRYAATVIEVSKNGKRVKIQFDESSPADGFDYYGNQVYTHERNPNGHIFEFSWRERGVWVEVGKAKAIGYLTLGHRDRYSDPSF